MSNFTSRLGFHYFPNSRHYREQDLQTWLPVLKRLGASWLTILAPATRAIPENFIYGLIRAGIKPVLHFPLSLTDNIDNDELIMLFRLYSRWGVRYVALFDKPNSRSAWRAGIWAQEDLVERFLDIFLPLAQAASKEGLIPIFPPLEPGGDYWDLAFLQAALRGISRRARADLIENLALGAYAWVNKRPLDWGIGGPNRWPGARPYFTPQGVQDQLGFRIFDWYTEISRDEIGKDLPILLLRAGARQSYDQSDNNQAALQHADLNLEILKQLADDNQTIPENILACNIWLLAVDEEDAYQSQAWFKPDGSRLPAVDVFRQWVGITDEEIERIGSSLVIAQQEMDEISDENIEIEAEIGLEKTLIEDQVSSRDVDARDQVEELSMENVPTTVSEQVFHADVKKNERPDGEPSKHPIAHYVLLPLYAWGAGEWDLELIQPILQETHPTVGFSLAEARLARRVSVIGGPGAISEDILSLLRSEGCEVERILADGTVVAT